MAALALWFHYCDNAAADSDTAKALWDVVSSLFRKVRVCAQLFGLHPPRHQHKVSAESWTGDLCLIKHTLPSLEQGNDCAAAAGACAVAAQYGAFLSARGSSRLVAELKTAMVR